MPSSVVGAGSVFLQFYGCQRRSSLPELPRKFSNEDIRIMKFKREDAQEQRIALKKVLIVMSLRLAIRSGFVMFGTPHGLSKVK